LNNKMEHFTILLFNCWIFATRHTSLFITHHKGGHFSV